MKIKTAVNVTTIVVAIILAAVVVFRTLHPGAIKHRATAVRITKDPLIEPSFQVT